MKTCAAWRRYEATQWLESQVGPLGIPKQPSERELISCLRNGLILCKVINKIYPGAVPKVFKSHVTFMFSSRLSPLLFYFFFSSLFSHHTCLAYATFGCDVYKVVDNPVGSQSFTWDSQPLPAYQYFENVRNFLVAAEELKLPAFEASDLERVSYIDGTSCICMSDCYCANCAI